MNHTLKYVRFIGVIIFYFLISTSNLSAIDFFRHEYIIKNNSKILEQITTKVQKCKKSKYNNFKDRAHLERTILIYLNTLLDKILLNNKDILEQYGRTTNEFCIDIDNIENASFASSGLGLILIDINEIYFALQQGRYIQESYIVASIAHEIAHDLLNHILEELNIIEVGIYDTSSFKDKYIDINEYNFNGDLTNSRDERTFRRKYQYGGIFSLFSSSMKSKLNEEFIEWNKFYPTHYDYISFKQNSEIAADNLGLKLYLNTEFNAEDFEKRYLVSASYYNDPTYSYRIPDLYVKLLKDNTYLTEGELALKEQRFDKFMDSIKYARSSDHHPTIFWRYWNARTQRESYQNYNTTANIDDTNIINGFYFRIDLSKLKKLEELHSFFSNQDKLNFSIVDKNDLRVYLIDKLLNNSKDISYSLEFSPDNRYSISLIREDETMLLKAYDIFQILIIKNYLLQFSKCSKLFRSSKDNSYEQMYEFIENVFRPF